MHLTATTVCGPSATTGVLNFDADPTVLYTIERPLYAVKDGDPVCVPAARYDMIPYMSPKHGATWCLHNPSVGIYGDGPAPPGGRDYCELHSMNFATQSDGCMGIGLGSTTAVNPDTGNPEPEVYGGLHGGMDKLRAILGTDRHTIDITRSGYSS